MVKIYQFQFRQFHFKNFYHPFVCDLAKLVYHPLKGIQRVVVLPLQSRYLSKHIKTYDSYKFRAVAVICDFQKFFELRLWQPHREL